MGLFVLGVIFIIPGLIAVLLRRVKYTDYRDREQAFPTWPIGLGLVFIGLLVVAWSASYSVDSGEATLIKSRSGEVVGFDTTPGLGFTAPWNKTSTWDLRNRRITFEGKGDGDDEPAIAAALDGSANGAINQVVTYSLPRDRETLTRLEREHRNQDNFEDNVLIASLKSVTQDEAVKFGPYVIKEERGTLDANITNALIERWGEEGAEVQSIEITGISLDEETEAKLREVTARQADVAEAEAALEAARIEGETVREEAKAQADADQITRCGAKVQEVTREVSGREIQTTEVVPLPNEQCQNRLNEQVLMAKWIDAIEALAGKEGNTIVVPNDLSAILNMSGAGG